MFCTAKIQLLCQSVMVDCIMLLERDKEGWDLWRGRWSVRGASLSDDD